MIFAEPVSTFGIMLEAPLHERNSHAQADPPSGNFRFGHPNSTFMLRGFRLVEHDPQKSVQVFG